MEGNSDRLKVLKCQKCHGLFIPPKYVCPQCAGSQLEEVSLSGKGKIMTYTTVRVAPSGFENQVPYDIAIIELSERINLTARLIVRDEEGPKIGGEVIFLRKEAGTYWFESSH
ncbi:MAG: hypothetical protein A2157_19165 [Deltaproteobacteria bacterium RBG_16_47_11]|nr:MAG: hypothetical protein A2157_19165 [Deltaproteobacteria bacterium RBG_16_47_11]